MRAADPHPFPRLSTGRPGLPALGLLLLCACGQGSTESENQAAVSPAPRVGGPVLTRPFLDGVPPTASGSGSGGGNGAAPLAVNPAAPGIPPGASAPGGAAQVPQPGGADPAAAPPPFGVPGVTGNPPPGSPELGGVVPAVAGKPGRPPGPIPPPEESGGIVSFLGRLFGRPAPPTHQALSDAHTRTETEAGPAAPAGGAEADHQRIHREAAPGAPGGPPHSDAAGASSGGPQPYLGVQPRPPSTRPERLHTPAGLLERAVGFESVAEAAGLDHAWKQPSGDPPPMVDMMGQGAAWLDYDQDGWPDILLVDTPPRLYKNLRNGHFQEDKRALNALPVESYRGVAVGDFNADGFTDLYLSAYAGGRLLQNERGKFKDVTGSLGLEPHGWGMPAAFADLDRDGDLDLILGGYLEYDVTKRALCQFIGLKEECGPQFYKPALPVVYRNDGSRFEDVTTAWGFQTSNGRNLGILTRDLDGDGWLEVLFANDASAGDLFVLTDGSKKQPSQLQFENRGVIAGVAYDYTGQVHSGMGIDTADVQGDGRLDLVVTAMYQEGASLYESSSSLSFKDLGYKRGVASATWPYVGFGALFVDVDNNGAADLFIVNGHIHIQAERTLVGSTFLEPMLLLYNEGGSFYDLSARLSNLPAKLAARGLAVADYDRDGLPDLLVTRLEGPVLLLHNVSQATGHWLSLRLLQRNGVDAHGVSFTLRTGEVTRLQSLRIEGSYLSSSEVWQPIGLGAAARVDAIDVTWAPDRRERFGPFEADRRVKLVEGTGTALTGK